ncbi:cupin domain-containing protein [Mycobacterium spongiae]|uniref:Cupin domain-containing protein n=1 Tax=Mycobacterium spongiae TaxID=886343 RepID=A0A975K112_9MYCO|nr:cupin domain-containing protein [Mycobacterium spongiae]QUR68183.1 cupin domain-containing protein [Mycobacterium spongiae]
MTFQNGAVSTPAILTSESQQAVWFLGALVRIRAGGDATAGSLAVLEHQCERGYGSPMHRHLADEETFFVIEGELRVEVGGQVHTPGAGAVAVLPRGLPHAFVVTSPQARVLTFHTPAGFDRFVLAAGTPASLADTMPPDEVPPDPAALAALARSYGIEIVGPPPTL